MLQNPSVLLSEPASALLDRPLTDFRGLFGAGVALGAEHLEALDYVLRHAVLRLLVRRAPEPELAAAEDALRRLFPPSRDASLGRWAVRWLGLADLLDARRAALREQDADAVRRLAHADELLALVATRPGLSQAEIGERLGLKPANLSRILGALEANELLTRRAEGREKRVYPIPEAMPARARPGFYARLMCSA